MAFRSWKAPCFAPGTTANVPSVSPAAVSSRTRSGKLRIALAAEDERRGFDLGEAVDAVVRQDGVGGVPDVGGDRRPREGDSTDRDDHDGYAKRGQSENTARASYDGSRVERGVAAAGFTPTVARPLRPIVTDETEEEEQDANQYGGGNEEEDAVEQTERVAENEDEDEGKESDEES